MTGWRRRTWGMSQRAQQRRRGGAVRPAGPADAEAPRAAREADGEAGRQRAAALQAPGVPGRHNEVQSRSADTQWELPAGAVTGTEKLGCACTSLEPGSHFTWNGNTHAKNARQRSIKKDCMGTFSAAGLLELELVAFENFAVRMDGE